MSDRFKGAGDWRFIQVALSQISIRTIYLYGPPGIGKTYCAYSYGRIHAGVFPITLTPETPASELIGHYFPAGNELRWRDGPFTKAMRSGGRLVINEITHAGSDVLAILYPVLESEETAQLMLPDGNIVRPAQGFHVIVTDNSPPDSLPEALRDRFDSVIHVRWPHPDALNMIDESLRAIALRSLHLDDERRITMRQWLNISKFGRALGYRQACRVVLGKERGKELHDAIVLAGKAGDHSGEDTDDQ